jgi:hypothetical protein
MIASYGFAMVSRMHAGGGDWNWVKMKVREEKAWGRIAWS